MLSRRFNRKQKLLAWIYMSTVCPIIPLAVESNDNAKKLVKEKIYEFVVTLTGDQHAPKITDMLIDLPLDNIRDYLQDYNKFMKKTMQALILLFSQVSETSGNFKNLNSKMEQISLPVM